MVDKKQAIIPIFNENINGTRRNGIVIDPFLYDGKLGDLKKINYPNFKYIDKLITIADDETGQIKSNMHFIEVSIINELLLKAIVDTINELIQDKTKSVKETIDEIFDYFKKHIFKKEIRNELLGDLGEAIFILKSFENGIDVMQYLRRIDESLYDFDINKRFVEVKTSSKEKNEFTLSNSQLEETKDKTIIICKLKYVSSRVNILDIYQKIASYKTLSSLLIDKQKKWEQINELCKEENYKNDIINDYSVILDNCQLGVFDNSKLPIVKIEDKGALKKITYTINCTDSELQNIETFYEKEFNN